MDESLKIRIGLGVVALFFFFGSFSMPSWTTKGVCFTIGIIAGVILFFLIKKDLQGGNNNNGTTNKDYIK